MKDTAITNHNPDRPPVPSGRLRETATDREAQKLAIEIFCRHGRAWGVELTAEETPALSPYDFDVRAASSPDHSEIPTHFVTEVKVRSYNADFFKRHGLFLSLDKGYELIKRVNNGELVVVVCAALDRLLVAYLYDTADGLEITPRESGRKDRRGARNDTGHKFNLPGRCFVEFPPYSAEEVERWGLTGRSSNAGGRKAGS